MKKHVTDWRISCVGLLCIAGLEGYALSQGINGIVLTSVIAIIASIIGYKLPRMK